MQALWILNTFVSYVLHAEVRWLSKGKVLSHIHELQNELLTLFEIGGHERFCNYLKNDLCMSRLEYLTKIFGQRCRLNSGMQGRNANILTSTDKSVAFRKKLLYGREE